MANRKEVPQPTRSPWMDPSQMRGAIVAAVLGGLIFWGLLELAHHITIVWH
jgi:hypothetical protein